MTLQARYAGRYGEFPIELLDEETGHVFGHATDLEALHALVRLVWIDEPREPERPLSELGKLAFEVGREVASRMRERP